MQRLAVGAKCDGASGKAPRVSAPIAPASASNCDRAKPPNPLAVDVKKSRRVCDSIAARTFISCTCCILPLRNSLTSTTYYQRQTTFTADDRFDTNATLFLSDKFIEIQNNSTQCYPSSRSGCGYSLRKRAITNNCLRIFGVFCQLR